MTKRYEGDIINDKPTNSEPHPLEQGQDGIPEFDPKRAEELKKQYKSEKEATKETPYFAPTPEEKKELLKFDRIAELSTEEYIELWQHLNPYYVSHITRQGIRDHIASWGAGGGHIGGYQKWYDGFKDIVRQSTLKDHKKLVGLDIYHPNKNDFTKDKALTKRTIKHVKEDTRKKFKQESHPFPDSQTIQESEEWYFNHGISNIPPFEDSTSVHMGLLNVLEDQYGAENNNECFIIFPTDVLMSQCGFCGPSDLTRTPSSNNHNEFLVWNENGIPINAGITFLPKSAMVDSETGSLYATEIRDGIRVPIKGSDGKILLTNNAIPAQEYWEDYFQKHPEQKPAHLIYYDGTPKEAVLNFLTSNGILEAEKFDTFDVSTNESKHPISKGDTYLRDGKKLGFDEQAIEVAFHGSERSIDGVVFTPIGDSLTNQEENLVLLKQNYWDAAEPYVQKHYGLKDDLADFKNASAEEKEKLVTQILAGLNHITKLTEVELLKAGADPEALKQQIEARAEVDKYVRSYINSPENRNLILHDMSYSPNSAYLSDMFETRLIWQGQGELAIDRAEKKLEYGIHIDSTNLVYQLLESHNGGVIIDNLEKLNKIGVNIEPVDLPVLLIESGNGDIALRELQKLISIDENIRPLQIINHMLQTGYGLVVYDYLDTLFEMEGISPESIVELLSPEYIIINLEKITTKTKLNLDNVVNGVKHIPVLEDHIDLLLDYGANPAILAKRLVELGASEESLGILSNYLK